MNIDRAEKYAALNRFEAAWDILESLPLPERIMPRSRRLRLLCQARMAKWEQGELLASSMIHGDEDDRLIAAAFYHTLAVAHLQDRSYAEARAAAQAAVAAWPGSHLSMLDDPRLDGLF